MNADEIASRFACRLRELRVAKGWTQRELAAKARLTIGVIANLEQGRRNPTWAAIIRLGFALGIDCGEFQKRPADAQRKRGRPKGKGE
jgi:transcriptional regulator with XRE-family HTH domain